MAPVAVAGRRRAGTMIAHRCLALPSPWHAAHGRDDTFVHPHHSERLFQAYGGDKNLVTFDGEHNSGGHQHRATRACCARPQRSLQGRVSWPAACRLSARLSAPPLLPACRSPPRLLL